MSWLWTHEFSGYGAVLDVAFAGAIFALGLIVRRLR